jgi:hypothetical protein
MRPLPSRRPLRNSRCHAPTAERTEMTWILGMLLGHPSTETKPSPLRRPTFMKSSIAFAPMALSKFWLANAKLRLISRSCMSASTSRAGSPDFPILNATPTSWCSSASSGRETSSSMHRCAGARPWGCARSLRRARGVTASRPDRRCSKAVRSGSGSTT